MTKIAIAVFCVALCTLAAPAFADDYLYFGFNYSNTVANGNSSHGLGGTFSAIGDYGGAKNCMRYLALLLIYPVSGL